MKFIFRNIFIILIYIILYIPIIILVVNSFNLSIFGYKWHGLTLQWYDLLLKNDSLIDSAIHSLILGSCSSIISTILGTLVAVILYFYEFRFKKFITSMLFIIIIIPDIVLAISLLLLFVFLKIELGFYSLLIAHITFSLPIVVVIIYTRIKDFDVKILEAARDLSASEFIILKKIILPLLSPSIVSSWLLTMTLSMDDVIISSFITGPSYEILPLKIYSMVKIGISPEVNAIAAILLLFSFIFLFISEWITKKYI
ncbi:MAG: spermidine/putrescine ABC transporter permease PotC [Arsenophonus sp.]|nr:MAG: spermidine/putrescine ABC transporter permease PotC [Arsenophonus sp.]